MATSRDQIEHFEHEWEKGTYKHFSHSRRWLKRQMNRFIRRKNKNIEDDEIGYKQGRKPFQGWEY